MIDLIVTLSHLVKIHPALLLLVGLTWLIATAVTAMVGALPAPTKDSSAKYVFWFKAANSFVGMLQRAKSTAIENSPNFQAAAEKYLEQRYGPQIQGSQQQQTVVTDWQQTQNVPKEK